MPDSLRPHGLYSPWNSPGQNTGVGSLSLLQWIFQIQGLNLGLPHCRQILYQLSHKGSPTILEWVAYPFSSGSSRPRTQTGVICIASGFFTNWAIREAWSFWEMLTKRSFDVLTDNTGFFLNWKVPLNRWVLLSRTVLRGRSWSLCSLAEQNSSPELWRWILQMFYRKTPNLWQGASSEELHNMSCG